MDKNIDKERAIQLLVGFRNYLTSGNPIWDIDDVSKAFDIAIESLEQYEMAYEHGWTDAESEYRKILERKHGEWIIQDGKVVCSECFEPNLETNYCPNCGARMCDGND